VGQARLVFSPSDQLKMAVVGLISAEWQQATPPDYRQAGPGACVSLSNVLSLISLFELVL